MNYLTAHAVLVDFNKGAEFAISGSRVRAKNGVIRNLRICALGRSVVVTAANGKETRFQPDGRPFYSTVNQDLRLRFVRFVGKTTPSEEKEGVPLLKSLVLGDAAHCPKTREVVEAVVFRTNALEVVLRNEDGVTRVSTNYDHEGKHKWIKERSLVIGNLPPVKRPPAEAYLFRDRLGNLHAVERLKTVPPGWTQVGFSLLQG